MIKNILIIPKIEIAEANAFSSPVTVGFPAMTAWLGGVHALERKLTQSDFLNFRVNGVGVVSNAFKLRAAKAGYTTSLITERHPLKKKRNSNEFVSPSFVEDPKCNLKVSLIIEFKGVEPDTYDHFKDQISNELHKMRMAGGVIKSFQKPVISSLDSMSESYLNDFKKVTARLMPGYALLERKDLMLNAMSEGKDALDAIIEAMAVTYSCEGEDPSGSEPSTKTEWNKGTRKYKGWIVPIATGFQGLTEPSIALNQRDPETLHRFAEALVTLGEFKMPHKLTSVEDLLWSYHYDAHNNLYTCQQSK